MKEVGIEYYGSLGGDGGESLGNGMFELYRKGGRKGWYSRIGRGVK